MKRFPYAGLVVFAILLMAGEAPGQSSITAGTVSANRFNGNGSGLTNINYFPNGGLTNFQDQFQIEQAGTMVNIFNQSNISVTVYCGAFYYGTNTITTNTVTVPPGATFRGFIDYDGYLNHTNMSNVP